MDVDVDGDRAPVARHLTAAERAFIERMPKAELHVHLEGSVRPETLLDLGRKHGTRYPFTDVAGVREWYRFRDFPHFIEVYMGVCNSLLAEEDYARIAWELAEDAAAQHIRYLEVTFAPVSLIEPRLPIPVDAQWAGIRAGAARARRELGVRLAFILDVVRVRPPAHTLALARWAVAHRDEYLVALGLGGTEVGYPASLHREAIDHARANGMHVTLHAGETAGPESVWDALACGAERIGHGVTSVQDPALVRHLAERGIVLEVSPTSNVQLGVAPSIAAHPFRALDTAGVQVTVNSDDPPMFGCTLTGEFLALAREQGYSVDELAALSLRAVHASFLPAAERAALAASFVAEQHALRADLFGDGEPG